MNRIKHLCRPPQTCLNGHHTFIPVAWKKTQQKEVCTRLICQHCLAPADKYDQEVMAKHHDEETKKKAKKGE